MPKLPEGDFVEDVARAGIEELRAPARLKSRVYSALMRQAAQSGPLRSLPETKAHGRGLCVFETLVTIAPAGAGAASLNYCRICHARILGEQFENAPIFWRNCPYVRFQNR